MTYARVRRAHEAPPARAGRCFSGWPSEQVGVFVYHSGVGRSGSGLGAGSLAFAVLLGLLAAGGMAWTMFHKGW